MWSSIVRNHFLGAKSSFSRLHVKYLNTEILKQLEEILDSKRVLTSESAREHHGKDEGPYKPKLADVVVFPKNTEEVQKVVQLCHFNNIPMTPFGTGTGLEGGVNALFGGVCFDLSKMDRIFNLNVDDFNVTVEPGVTRKTLNNYIRDTGTWFPVDPGADASLCGMAATSASGTNTVRYGTMKENVLNMEVILADGTIIHTAGKDRCTKKSSAGFNLTDLFIGSEGTLGIITNVSLKLHPTPESKAACICSFNTIFDAVATTIQLTQLSVPLARIEFLDKPSVIACNSYSKTSIPEKSTLFMEFHGSSTDINNQIQVVDEVLKSNAGEMHSWATEEENRNALWKARHELFYACLALRPGSKAVITDVCVPVTKLPEAITFASDLVSSSGLIGPIFGHVGDGNFHSILLCDLNNPEEVEIAKNIARDIAEKALTLGGTCTGEHGIGQGKIKLLEQEVGAETINVMKKIKLALDPKLLLNRGKVLDFTPHRENTQKNNS